MLFIEVFWQPFTSQNCSETQIQKFAVWRGKLLSILVSYFGLIENSMKNFDKETPSGISANLWA